MPVQARRTALDVNDSSASHPGLFLQRYIATLDDQYAAWKNVVIPQRGQSPLQNMLFKAKEVYEHAFQRFKDEIVHFYYPQSAHFQVQGRLSIGLGTASPTETGLTLHHTYGVPYLPASALKGLAAHFCHSQWGQSDERYKLGQEYHRTLFGTKDISGLLCFHDGWLLPESVAKSICADIMTVHHQDYYMSKDGNVAPTDMDEPNPVPFLSIQGTFLVVLSSTENQASAESWVQLGMELLKQALDEWGLGAKTSSGYGRLISLQQDQRRR